MSASHHTDDVLADWKGEALTRGVEQHIEAMKEYVASAGWTPPKWRDGAVAEEYIRS